MIHLQTKKGIAVGDYLHQVDEFKLDEGRQVNDVEQILTGIAGTQVDIITSKAGRRKHTTTLQRNNSHPQIVETKLVDALPLLNYRRFKTTAVRSC
ncbi:hypothetical protein [Psychrobacter sp. JCM 18901]|uniref:hypothetical protein n=1 Tax=Psychrobacter sp. JCM 18901 TaxID=1298609 RepID=UPI0004ADC079|nr:hypothetical protein [Psychrobacter sp. JCM 18901]